LLVAFATGQEVNNHRADIPARLQIIGQQVARMLAQLKEILMADRTSSRPCSRKIPGPTTA